ncbi:MAG TPA: prepilin peptidase [Acidobacteriota bacterium]|nr:prepilin peptidase [Acidobacteriota bacterium]HQO25622.1 prepilin peptidase [Acidobacteriota bacterium]HQP74208.1 prepilin peptidase [Acidobacteriota bacterium]
MPVPPVLMLGVFAAALVLAFLLDLLIASRLRGHLRRELDPAGPADRMENVSAGDRRIAGRAVTVSGTPEPLMLLLALAMRPSIPLDTLLAVRRVSLKVPGLAAACRLAPFCPLFELMFVAVTAGLLGVHGWSEAFRHALLFLTCAWPLGWVSWQDAENCISPDIFTFGGTIAGFAAACASPSRGLPAGSLEAPIDALAGAVVLGGGGWLIGWLYKRHRGREGLGLGAVKAMMMTGAFWGVVGGCACAFIASCAGSLIGLGIMSLRRDKPPSEIPFTPLLVLAGLVWAFVGWAVMDWYVSLPSIEP